MNNMMYTTCQDAHDSGETVSGTYIIDPDGATGVDPFSVYCNLSMTPALTIVHHDREDPLYIKINGGSDNCHMHTFNVTYTGANLSQIEQLVIRSAQCIQSIRIECKDSSCQAVNDRSGNYIASWKDWSLKSTLCQPSKYFTN